MLGSLHEEALPKLTLRDKGGIESRWDKGLRPRYMETRTESLRRIDWRGASWSIRSQGWMSEVGLDVQALHCLS